MKHLVLLLCCGALLAGCGSGGSVPADAEKTAATITGDSRGAAADNPQCRMFSQAEIAEFAGEAVKPGGNGAGVLSCNWLAADGSGVVFVTVAPPENHVETTGADGYRALPDVGSQGFVAGKGSSWTAGTLANDKAFVVAIDASGGTEAQTIALLKAAIAREKA